MSEENTVVITGAENETSEEAEAANVSGEGEETQSSEEGEKSEDSTSQEAEEGDEGEEWKEEERHKPTAEERKAQLQQEIRELANTKRALKETLAAEVEERVKSVIQKTESEKPPFIEIQWDRINEIVASEMDAIENLKAEGKAAEALFKQRSLDKLCVEIEENEAKRQKWTAEQETKRQQQQKNQWTEQAIADAAEIVRKSKGIKAEDWKLADEWFAVKAEEDPLIDLQYKEKLATQGPAHALIWKHEYVTQEAGKKAKADREKREEGKRRQMSVSPSSPDGVGVVKTFSDFMKLGDKQKVEFAKKNPKTFERILESKRNKAL